MSDVYVKVSVGGFLLPATKVSMMSGEPVRDLHEYACTLPAQ